MKKFDIAIIGGGSAGLTAARLAAQLGVSVVLFEKNRLGGDCLYTGCIPSKSLVDIARKVHDAKNMKEFGLSTSGKINYNAIRKSIEKNIIHIRDRSDNRASLEQLGIVVVPHNATFTSSKTIKAGSDTYHFKKAVIATGSSPKQIKIQGLKKRHIITSDSIWTLTKLPKHLVIVGAGPVGLELGQAYAMLGVGVTIVEKSNTILSHLDPEIADSVTQGLKEAGVNILLDAAITEVRDESKLKIIVRTEGRNETCLADKVLLAVGRTPNTSSLGLKKIDIDLKPNKGIVVDHALRTAKKNIYAAGDCIGGTMLTHYAAEQAGAAVVHALVGVRRKVNWKAVPWVLFTTPEIAHVGAHEQDLQLSNTPYDTEVLQFEDIDSAVTRGNSGHITVILDKKK